MSRQPERLGDLLPGVLNELRERCGVSAPVNLSHSPAETRTAMPAGDEPGETETAASGDLSYLCDPACPICTDTTPPEKWDAPWPAYRWSAELEEISR